MSKITGILDSLEQATQPSNRLAFACGSAIGGIIPVAVYWLAHVEAPDRSWLWWIVGGGCAFSAATVFEWAKIAFKSPFKAAGFVVLLEGAMLASNTPWLTLAMLSILVLINGTACACALIMDRASIRSSQQINDEQPESTADLTPAPVIEQLNGYHYNGHLPTPQNDDEFVLSILEQHPDASLRQLEALTGKSKSTLARLKRYRLAAI